MVKKSDDDPKGYSENNLCNSHIEGHYWYSPVFEGEKSYELTL